MPDVTISWYNVNFYSIDIVPGDCHGLLGLAMTAFLFLWWNDDIQVDHYMDGKLWKDDEQISQKNKVELWLFVYNQRTVMLAFFAKKRYNDRTIDRIVSIAI